MKSEHIVKILLTGFVGTLLVYIVAFGFLQSCRTTKGPWRVVFTTDNAGTPGVLISQKKLHVSQRLTFTDRTLAQSNFVREVIFNDPTRTNLPFGEIIFQDLTFLPGTVAMNLFGHEIEILPRVLTVDKQEHPWKEGEVISVSGEGKAKPRQAK